MTDRFDEMARVHMTDEWDNRIKDEADETARKLVTFVPDGGTVGVADYRRGALAIAAAIRALQPEPKES